MDLSGSQFDLQFFLNIRSRIKGKCSGIIDEEYGMMRLEAFLFALDLVNTKENLLYGNNLGANIHDTCTNPNKEIICSVGTLFSLVGLIGPENSDPVSIGSIIYSSFTPRTALVTYGGTNTVFNDKEQYPNLFHTVPSDADMADALTDVAAFYNWTSVALIYSKENTGNGMTSFKSFAAKKGICIKYSITMRNSLTDEFFRQALSPLRAHRSIRVVFLLLSDVEAHALFMYLSRHGSDFASLQFIGGKDIGTRTSVLSGDKSTDVGLLTLEIESHLNSDFRSYFLALNPYGYNRNPFFAPFWEQIFNCSLKANGTEGKPLCNGNETLKEGKGFYANTPVMPVINAVLAFGHALSLVLQELCSPLVGAEKAECLGPQVDGNRTYSRKFFLEAILAKLPTINFSDPSGHHFQFDTHRRQKLNYRIYNTQTDGNKVRFVSVGTWKNMNSSVNPRFAYKERLNMNTSYVKWRLNSTPVSKCGEVCGLLEIKSYDQIYPCCWTCVSCPANSIVVNNTCSVCSKWTRHDPTSRTCISLPIKTIDMSSAVPAILITLVVLCDFVVVVILVIYTKHFNSQPIRVTSRELSLVSLAGLFIMFLTPLAFLASPSSFICNLQQCLFGTSMTLCSVPLFLKALVVFRVVRKAKNSILTPKLSTKRSQMLICTGLIFINILLCALWLQGNPGIVKRHISTDKQHVVTHCEYDVFSLIINFSYPCIIMALATVFALRTTTKNVPYCVNEGKRIALTSALTCFTIFLYLVSFTVYVNDKDSFIQEYSISLTYVIIGGVNVSCVFLPRVAFVLKSAQTDVAKSSTLPKVTLAIDKNAEEVPSSQQQGEVYSVCNISVVQIKSFEEPTGVEQ